MIFQAKPAASARKQLSQGNFGKSTCSSSCESMAPDQYTGKDFKHIQTGI
jgi:hypothetical protein